MLQELRPTPLKDVNSHRCHLSVGNEIIESIIPYTALTTFASLVCSLNLLYSQSLIDITLVENTPSDLSFAKVLAEYRPPLRPFEEIYQDIHQNPELSCQETCTTSIVASRLTTLDFIVHERIGGTGVVGVFHNGDGRAILLRADMDGLPVLEETGLTYASKKRMKDYNGQDVPVMHACGHDMHVATLMATAQLLHAARSHWHGTLICLFQPNEELAGGAQAMIDDGLCENYGIPLPDMVLGQHVQRWQ